MAETWFRVSGSGGDAEVVSESFVRSTDKYLFRKHGVVRKLSGSERWFSTPKAAVLDQQAVLEERAASAKRAYEAFVDEKLRLLAMEPRLLWGLSV